MEHDENRPAETGAEAHEDVRGACVVRAGGTTQTWDCITAKECRERAKELGGHVERFDPGC